MRVNAVASAEEAVPAEVLLVEVMRSVILWLPRYRLRKSARIAWRRCGPCPQHCTICNRAAQLDVEAR